MSVTPAEDIARAERHRRAKNVDPDRPFDPPPEDNPDPQTTPPQDQKSGS